MLLCRGFLAFAWWKWRHIHICRYLLSIIWEWDSTRSIGFSVTSLSSCVLHLVFKVFLFVLEITEISFFLEMIHIHIYIQVLFKLLPCCWINRSISRFFKVLLIHKGKLFLWSVMMALIKPFVRISKCLTLILVFKFGLLEVWVYVVSRLSLKLFFTWRKV